MPAIRSETRAGAQPSTVSVRVVRSLVRFLEQQGRSGSEFLLSAQVVPEKLASAEARFPRSEVDRLCGVALNVSGDSALGLHWGARLSLSSSNPLFHLVSHAATLRDGLDALLRFHPVVSDSAQFELSERGEEATLRYVHRTRASPQMVRFASEVFLGGLAVLLRSFDSEAAIIEASCEYQAPIYRHEYTRVFGGSESFDKPTTAVVFERRLLDQPSPHNDQEVHEALRAVAERYLLRTQRASFALRVRDLLMNDREGRLPDMAAAARALGVSVRSLRRHLAGEGVSFTTVVEDARLQVATDYLVNQRISGRGTVSVFRPDDRPRHHGRRVQQSRTVVRTSRHLCSNAFARTGWLLGMQHRLS